MFWFMLVLLHHEAFVEVNALVVLAHIGVNALLKGVIQLFMLLSICTRFRVSAVNFEVYVRQTTIFSTFGTEYFYVTNHFRSEI